MAWHGIPLAGVEDIERRIRDLTIPLWGDATTLRDTAGDFLLWAHTELGKDLRGRLGARWDAGEFPRSEAQMDTVLDFLSPASRLDLVEAEVCKALIGMLENAQMQMRADTEETEEIIKPLIERWEANYTKALDLAYPLLTFDFNSNEVIDEGERVEPKRRYKLFRV